MEVFARHQQDGQLYMVVSGDFSFEAARQLLLVTKQYWESGRHANLVVELQGVGNLSSCSVGVLVLLKELVGTGQFAIRLSGCGKGVRTLFESGVLDRYFDNKSAAAPQLDLPAFGAADLPLAVARA